MKRAILLILSLCIAALGAQDGFGILEGEAAAGLKASGEGRLVMKAFTDPDADKAVQAAFIGKLKLEYEDDKALFFLKLTPSVDFPEFALVPGSLVDSAGIRAYLPIGYLEAGLLKLEWGRGDGFHAVDPINPLDQRLGPQESLDDMKRAVPMIHMLWNIFGKTSLELVYEPYFTPMAISATGPWALGDFTLFPPIQPAPDMMKLGNLQAGARLSSAIGPVDLGAVYYYGHLSEPGYRISMVTDIVYTRAQLFGLEAGMAAGPFTFMIEGGYWLSEDHGAADSGLYNDRMVYLAGIDVTIPGTDLYLSAQLTGKYVLDFEELNPMDVDLMASAAGEASSNTLVGVMEWPFVKDMFSARAVCAYEFESESYMAMASLTWEPSDNLDIALKGSWFGGPDTSNSPYAAWDANDSIAIEFKYLF